MIAVVLDSSHGEVIYGPFPDGERLLAERFAKYLNEEVDPARLAFVDPLRWKVEDIAWRSPLIEVLNWRDAMQRTARDVVPIIRCEVCQEDRPTDHDCRACVPLEETLRRHLHAVADQIHPTSETAPELPRAADDADDADTKGTAS